MPKSSIARIVEPEVISPTNLNISDELLFFYSELLEKYCARAEDDKPKDDPKTYGETVYVDADLLQLIHARVNIGRKVAHRKTTDKPAIFDLADNPDQLFKELKDEKREGELLMKVEALANSYDLEPGIVRDAFRWMMDKTMDIEIDWIQQAKKLNNSIL